MGEHLWLTAVPAAVLIGWWLLRRPRRKAPLTPLEQANRKSAANRLNAAHRRLDELVAENERLSLELSRTGLKLDAKREEVEQLKDQRLEERDELAQRLESCTCGVGRAIAVELEEDGHG